jgi:hypothetical protein
MERFMSWNQFQLGALEAWLSGAYLLSMFIVVAFRPHRIGDPQAFRRSQILFVLFLVIPVAMMLLINVGVLVNPGRNPQDQTTSFMILQFSVLVQRGLLGFSIFEALRSFRLPADRFTIKD